MSFVDVKSKSPLLTPAVAAYDEIPTPSRPWITPHKLPALKVVWVPVPTWMLMPQPALLPPSPTNEISLAEVAVQSCCVLETML